MLWVYALLIGAVIGALWGIVDGTEKADVVLNLIVGAIIGCIVGLIITGLASACFLPNGRTTKTTDLVLLSRPGEKAVYVREIQVNGIAEYVFRVQRTSGLQMIPVDSKVRQPSEEPMLEQSYYSDYVRPIARHLLWNFYAGQLAETRLLLSDKFLAVGFESGEELDIP